VTSLTRWFRRFFSSDSPEAEAAEREEYDLPDRGAAEVERDRFRGPYPTVGGANAADDELSELKPPSDPSP